MPVLEAADEMKLPISYITGLSAIGAILIAFGQPFYANLIWSISNPILALHKTYTNA